MKPALRPISQHFGPVSDLKLGDKALWIQPGSRFERSADQTHTKRLGDEFTIEAIAILDRVYPDASVNTLCSRVGKEAKNPVAGTLV